MEIVGRQTMRMWVKFKKEKFVYNRKRTRIISIYWKLQKFWYSISVPFSTVLYFRVLTFFFSLKVWDVVFSNLASSYAQRSNLLHHEMMKVIVYVCKTVVMFARDELQPKYDRRHEFASTIYAFFITTRDCLLLQNN